MSNAFLSVVGSKQGQFRGDAETEARRAEWMTLIAVHMGVESPRDVVTGEPTGRRQFSVVTITKFWGEASVQGLSACSENEGLTEVVLQFTRLDPDGHEHLFQTVKLTEATLVSIQRSTVQASDGSLVGQEDWGFNFRKIEVIDNDAAVTFSDDWQAISS